MNIKIDNMVDLRAFCLEQAIKVRNMHIAVVLVLQKIMRITY